MAEVSRRFGVSTPVDNAVAEALRAGQVRVATLMFLVSAFGWKSQEMRCLTDHLFRVFREWVRKASVTDCIKLQDLMLAEGILRESCQSHSLKRWQGRPAGPAGSKQVIRMLRALDALPEEVKLFSHICPFPDTKGILGFRSREE